MIHMQKMSPKQTVTDIQNNVESIYKDYLSDNFNITSTKDITRLNDTLNILTNGSVVNTIKEIHNGRLTVLQHDVLNRLISAIIYLSDMSVYTSPDDLNLQQYSGIGILESRHHSGDIHNTNRDVDYPRGFFDIKNRDIVTNAILDEERLAVLIYLMAIISGH